MNSQEGHPISEQKVREILEKYDPESGYRNLTGWLKGFTSIGLLGFSVFQLYTSIFGILPAQQQRSAHLAFALGLVFLLYPASRKGKWRRKERRISVPWYDLMMAALGVYVGLYWVIDYDKLVSKSIVDFTPFDLTVACLAILLVLEAARRVVGLPITIVVVIFLAYAFLGEFFPGFLQHPGLNYKRVLGTMYFSTEGILGTPLMVSSTYIFLFLLFGSFLIKTGAGQYFNDLALKIAGRSIGGPAKVAVFSSALQGTISGSSVSNVVTSGVFTIPMMQRLGYSKEFAGAVEAASSTGGQLMPPVMGAAAFLMVEFIGDGITYWDVAKTAAIPAILYFAGIWIVTHFEAKRIGLRGVPKEELPKTGYILKNLYLLAPIVAIIVFLGNGNSVMRAALYAIVVAMVVGMIHKRNQLKVTDFIDALIDGARSALPVAAATAAAGIIVGVVTLSGLGLKLANGLLELSGGNILFTLFLTMIASLVLGMGTPTTANYIITSTVAAPAIVLLGYPELAAHLFVFYFGIIADITPPVALAAFAASGISGGEPIRTGLQSSKLALAAFLIPYVFVLSPELILIHPAGQEIAWWKATVNTGWLVCTAFIGIIAVGAGVVGVWFRKMRGFERIGAILAGLLLISPDGFTDGIGIIMITVLLMLQIVVKEKRSARFPES